MNWKLLEKILPMALRTARTIFDGIRDGADNDEIRRRLAQSDVILDEELDDLRNAKDDLDDYVRTGR